MKKTKKEMENKAQEAVKKAAEAVRAANEALAEANTALQVMQELSDDELDHVAGGEGGSAWSDVPIVKPHPYPVKPDPVEP